MRSSLFIAALLCAGTAFARPAAPEGAWLGTLDAGKAKLRVGFEITRRPDGALVATMSSLDQGATAIPCDKATWSAPTLHVQLAKLGVTYQATLAGNEMKGTFKQGPQTFPLVLHAVETLAEPPPRRPQEPKPPFPYRTEEVTVVVPETYGPQRASASVTLAGTLTIPPGKGPFPGVVLITGSGAQDRDETVFGHKPFLVLADALTRAGIVTLRFDERGVGRSQGTTKDRTTDDNAQDIEAQLALLVTRPEVNKKRVGLLGHSEGGLIAPMVAAGSKVPRFLVLLAGTGKPGRDVIVEQKVAQLRAGGASEDEVGKQGRYLALFDDIVGAEADRAKQEASLRASLAKEPAVRDELVAQLALATPWYRRFLALDPQPYLRRCKVPVLALNGDKDLQVDVSNLALIEKGLRAGGNKHVEAHALPGLNHLFQHTTTGLGTEYTRIEETFAPEVIERISAFVLAR